MIFLLFSSLWGENSWDTNRETMLYLSRCVLVAANWEISQIYNFMWKFYEEKFVCSSFSARVIKGCVFSHSGSCSLVAAVGCGTGGYGLCPHRQTPPWWGHRSRPCLNFLFGRKSHDSKCQHGSDKSGEEVCSVIGVCSCDFVPPLTTVPG